MIRRTEFAAISGSAPFARIGDRHHLAADWSMHPTLTWNTPLPPGHTP